MPAAPYAAPFQDVRFIIGGHEFTRDTVGADVLLASRPLIEGVVRRRVLEEDNIKLFQLRPG